MSLASKTVTGSPIIVPAQPGAMALSPNGAYLVVTHFGGDPGFSLPRPTQRALAAAYRSSVRLGLIQAFCFGDTPLGVAFGNDGLALIVTTTQVLTFDPLSGATQALGSLYCDQALNGVLPTPCTFVAR